MVNPFRFARGFIFANVHISLIGVRSPRVGVLGVLPSRNHGGFGGRSGRRGRYVAVVVRRVVVVALRAHG